MIEKLYTVEEVAELASVTGRTIRNYLKSGRLTGRKIGGQWRFPESEVQRLLTGAPAEEMDAMGEGLASGSASSDLDPAAFYREPEEEDVSLQDAPAYEPPEPEPSPEVSYFGRPSVAASPYSATPAQNDTYRPNTAGGRPSDYAAPAPLPAAYPPPPQPSVNMPFSASYGGPQAPPPPVYSVAEPGQPASEAFIPDHRVAPAPGYAQSYQSPPPAAPASGYPSPSAENAPAGTSFAGNAPVNVPTAPAYPVPTPAANAAPPAASTLQPQPAAPVQTPVVEREIVKEPETAPVQTPPAAAEEDAPLPELSDVGKRVARFVTEVHDCSSGPQVCAVIDVHQAFSNAKLACERLAQVARQESEVGGILCQVFVEYDERYFVARYTLFGSSSFLLRCLKLLG